MKPEYESFHAGLFRRLKPLYGKKIDALWLEYETAADPLQKRRIEELLVVLAVKRLGLAIGDEKIVLDPPPEHVISTGEYTLGAVVYPGKVPYPFTLHRQELLRHMFVLGPTGTGKSTFLLGLLRQLLRDGLPFWSIDFKRNYRCLLLDESGEKMLVLTVGRETAPVALNMLRPPPGVERDEWVEALADIISASYLLLHGARNVLKSALLSAIERKGDTATLRDARDLTANELARARSGSRRYGWLESTHRTLDELGKLNALNAIAPVPFADLLSRPVVFELQGLGDDQKKCFCLYLLQAVLLLRKHQTDEREVVRHVLVFDEAHNVFPKDQWGELSVPSRLAREVREYGEAIIAATQQVDVADSLIANSGTKIILRTDYPKDVDFASKLLNIENKWVARIPVGQGIARLATRSSLPFLFSFPQQPLKNQLVSDDRVRERYTQWLQPVTAPVFVEEIKLSAEDLADREQVLLADIASHPISTVTQRYERLMWNPKTGNAVKDRLVASGLAAFEVLAVPGSRVKLLMLTPKGLSYAEKHEIPVASRGRAGLEHEFWRDRITERCAARGYRVTSEYLLRGGGRVDLHATNGQRTFLIEIETGKSDVKRNIEKCQWQPATLVVFCTNDEVLREMQAIDPTVIVLTPTTLSVLHDLLNGFTTHKPSRP